jgi:hypothetical protein
MDRINYSEEEKDVIFTDDKVIWTGEMSSKPDLEQALFLLQSKYYNPRYKKQKSKIWSEMLGLIQPYAKSLLLKRATGGRYIPPETIHDKSVHASLQFMSQYINRSGFHVGASFAGMLNWKVLESLCKNWEEENHLSLNSILGESDNELEGLQERIHFESVFGESYEKPEDFINNVNLFNTIHDLFNDIDETRLKEKEKLLLRMYFLICLKKPKNKHCKQMFLKRWANNYKTKKILDLTMKTFYDRLTK